MFDENGQAVKEAGPSRPVQVLGLSTVPRAGDTFLSTEEERTARQIAEKREAADRNAQLAKRRKRVTLESFDAAVAEGKMDTLNLIIKGDVSGAVEALEESLMKIDAGGDEVQLRVIHRGVGAITQNDVNLATVDNAVIIGFNVRPAERVAELADREGVEMKFYSVIYRAIEEIEHSQGYAQARVRGSGARLRRDPRGLPLLQVGQHRRFDRQERHHQAQRQGTPGARRFCGGRQPHHRVAASFQGRRYRGSRRFRVWYWYRLLQRHQGRRHYRDLGDARKAACLRLTR